MSNETLSAADNSCAKRVPNPTDNQDNPVNELRLGLNLKEIFTTSFGMFRYCNCGVANQNVRLDRPERT